MNGGLTQSFVTTFYYGLFDPFVRMYSFWSGDFSSYKYFIMFIQIILAMLIMHELLKEYDLKYKITGSLIVGFSGYFITTQFYYFIFSNSFIYFLLMMLGIKRIFEGKNSYIYILGWALLISINMPGAFAVMMFLGLYVLLLITDKKYTMKEILAVFKKFLMGTIIGLLLTTFIWIPQVEYLLMGSREQATQNIPLLTNIKESLTYMAGSKIFLYELTYTTIFLYLLKPNKKHLLNFIIFIILFNSPWLIYLANGFQKVNAKGYIYVIVPYTIWLLQLIKNKEIEAKHILYSSLLALITYYSLILGIISLVAAIISSKYKPDRNYITIYLLVIANLLIIINFNFVIPVYLYRLIVLYTIAAMLVLLKVTNVRYWYYAIIPIFVLASILGNIDKTSKYQAKDYNRIINDYDELTEYQENEELDMYRDFYIADSMKGGIAFNLQTNLSNPNYYTSVVNPYLIDSFNNYIDFQKNSPNDFHIKFINSYILANQFALDTMYEEGIVKKPIFYGTNTLFDSEYIDSLNKSTNLLYFFNGTYVEDSPNTPNLNLDQYKLIADGNIVVNKENEIITLPNLDKGELIISANIDETQDFLESNEIVLSVNEQINRIIYNYGVIKNKELTWYLPVTSPYMNIEYNSNLDEINLKDVNVYYIPLYELTNIEEDIIIPTDFSYDLNDSYSFEIDMPEEGYVSSTIPFDKGYKVYVNGKRVKTEIVNKDFLGFKVPKGNNEVDVKFKIHNIGIYLSISLLTLAYLIYKGVKNAINNRTML